MSLDELVSVAALLLYTFVVFILMLTTLHQAHERWGMPFPRYGFFSRIGFLRRKTRVVAGTNGRWKLDWTVGLFLLAITLRNLFTIKFLIDTGRPSVSWTFTELYLLNAFAGVLMLHYIRTERAHSLERKEEE